MEVHKQHPSDDHSSFKQAQVVVVMVAFPCQSHLNQLLQLSCLISSYNILVHYACSVTHIHQVKHQFTDINRLENTQINFHELPTPPFISPPPNPNNSSKFPSHLQPSFEATLHLRESMTALLHRISPAARRVIVIHDALLAYVVQDIANVPNAESYSFSPISAFSSFFEGWELTGKCILAEKEPEGLPSIEGCYTFEILNFIALQGNFLKLAAGYIYNTCRSIEGTYIDLLAKEEVNTTSRSGRLGR
ncbi:Zeatin O-xylosyltransferase [Actinidia chinensis var. chinensis]|uniref:Zeatin O-xylosyltransferase n=1 Tax=Actinidia chinensis var. chinensis TaxID=1590841 RepID=A0A2R6R590_ACTCC|nr:Zeatin O-xylosyltransferase [Actinidia chinensis var. chinensis]